MLPVFIINICVYHFLIKKWAILFVVFKKALSLSDNARDITKFNKTARYLIKIL